MHGLNSDSGISGLKDQIHEENLKNKNHKIQLTKALAKSISIKRKLFFVEKKFVVVTFIDTLFMGKKNITGSRIIKNNKTLESSPIEERNDLITSIDFILWS